MMKLAIAVALVCAESIVVDFDNYTAFPGVSFEPICADGSYSDSDDCADGHGGVATTSWMSLLVPDASQTQGHYNSTKGFPGGHSDILMQLCDLDFSACDWFNDCMSERQGGCGSALGKRTPNASVTTYLKTSKGEIVKGSVPGSRYFRFPGGEQMMKQKAAWALPASDVAKQCDADPECDAFIVKNDNTFGSVCTRTDHRDFVEAYFRLP
jgi:hypothetical protein